MGETEYVHKVVADPLKRHCSVIIGDTRLSFTEIGLLETPAGWSPTPNAIVKLASDSDKTKGAFDWRDIEIIAFRWHKLGPEYQDKTGSEFYCLQLTEGDPLLTWRFKPEESYLNLRKPRQWAS
jgi:hypothetical protein